MSGTAHYDSGDRVPLATGLTDVSHEFDCTFDAADGTQARAWVFAEPVTAAVGRSIVREACREGLHGPGQGAGLRHAVGGDPVQDRQPTTQAVALRGRSATPG